ncbi:MAG: PhoH family protein [Thiohalorhabdus sp.]|uniref:PhoH family protein n=1 Tax=Thiohalorhabdus sp. TaxID=3094134 RepID=UPI002FC36018
MREDKRLFVLDTNVLMHDPSCLFRFEEHDIFLPMVVLEELDAGKKGMSEVARNVRQVSRLLDDLCQSVEDFSQGMPLPGTGGRLFFQMDAIEHPLPFDVSQSKADNQILGVVLGLKHRHPELSVTLITNDINLRIKGRTFGLHVEDYTSDHTVEDPDLLYTGHNVVANDFWESHPLQIADYAPEEGRTFYRLSQVEENWWPNEFVYSEGHGEDEGLSYRVTSRQGPANYVIEPIRDYAKPNNAVWGITALNREQNFALNLLMDPEVDFVTLLGLAGTGKTLLTLAATLDQVVEEKRFAEAIITRATVPVGEDIGFLPGTEEEKMAPWMGAIEDNLELLTGGSGGGKGGKGSAEASSWAAQVSQDLLRHRIRIKSLNFMRGRTFLNRLIIIDEAQNLSPKQMKTLLTRAGPGTKMVCLGNINQIDTPYLTEANSGLTYVVDSFKEWQHGGHITLVQGERSRLADFANQAL